MNDNFSELQIKLSSEKDNFTIADSKLRKGKVHNQCNSHVTLETKSKELDKLHYEYPLIFFDR